MELSGQKKQIIAVSIIIPVYNVAEWLDRCMESVVHQTFSNFEVLLVDDGSTDGSAEKCDAWAKKDHRVRVIHKENEGPSKARNMGLQNANGIYLVFIDSDDWIDSHYLEVLYNRAVETDADMVECDVYRVNDETGEKTYRVCHGIMGLDYTLEEHMKYGYTAMWKCMFKKELFLKNGITFPDCHSEARAIYALLLAVSNRVENVHMGLYYYRLFRKGSLSEKPSPHNENGNAVGVYALQLLLEGFERCGLYARYEKILQETVKIKLSDLLASFLYRKEKEDFRLLAKNYYAFIAERFPDTPNYRYITFGGYNLNRILSHMNLIHDPYCRFNFSSLISLMHPVGTTFLCSHKNRYRQLMLQREINNAFWKILDEINPDYLFLDFMEERFDLVACGDGYLTKSGAYDGAQCLLEHVKVIERQTQSCQVLWEQSSKQFMERLQKEYPSIKVVLIKNYLSEKVGDVQGQELYSNIEEIQEMNQILKRYYDFFEVQNPTIETVEATSCKYYFTDKQYEYGAIPSHLNELVNQEIAKVIERSIEI